MGGRKQAHVSHYFSGGNVLYNMNVYFPLPITLVSVTGRLHALLAPMIYFGNGVLHFEYVT